MEIEYIEEPLGVCRQDKKPDVAPVTIKEIFANIENFNAKKQIKEMLQDKKPGRNQPRVRQETLSTPQ